MADRFRLAKLLQKSARQTATLGADHDETPMTSARICGDKYGPDAKFAERQCTAAAPHSVRSIMWKTAARSAPNRR
jgi:hypothetical protein